MEFQLEEWGDGTIRLVHWDAHRGNDVIFVLHESGLVAKAETHECGDGLIIVENLGLELRKLIVPS
jgi:hypothetical protein